MAKIVVIGVGAVGSTFAYTAQMAGIAEEIVLIDINNAKAEAEASDMSHAGSFLKPVDVHAGTYADCKDADIIVLTAGIAQSPGESRLALVERNAKICESIVDQIKKYGKDALILVVTNPVDVMTRIVLERSGFPPNHVLGSGTVLDSARFRQILSRYCKVDPRNVHAYVLGEHGDSEVPIWNHVRVAGIPLSDFLSGCDKEWDENDREKITQTVRNSAYHIIESKGATSYGVSQALLRIVEAYLRDEDAILTVSTMIQGQYGIEDVCLSVPCVINRTGISRIVEMPLEFSEKEQLLRSAEIIRETAKSVGY
ncbi:MAG: L-lactate dehydrogenase [Thermotogae bacterium]|nr:L-lactate dehydrogenase [Thermotogota bacterium]